MILHLQEQAIKDHPDLAELGLEVVSSGKTCFIGFSAVNKFASMVRLLQERNINPFDEAAKFFDDSSWEADGPIALGRGAFCVGPREQDAPFAAIDVSSQIPGTGEVADDVMDGRKLVVDNGPLRSLKVLQELSRQDLLATQNN